MPSPICMKALLHNGHDAGAGISNSTLDVVANVYAGMTNPRFGFHNRRDEKGFHTRNVSRAMWYGLDSFRRFQTRTMKEWLGLA